MRPFVFYSLASILFTFSFLFLISNACADELGATEISYATGEVSQTGGIEERDLSGGYRFHKYNLKVTAEPSSGFRYRVGSKRYEKNFDAARDDLDNRTDIYTAYFSLPLDKNDKSSFRLKADYGLCNKRYKHSPNLEYNQNSLSGALDIDFDKNYSLEFSGGIKDYDYIKDSDSNQLKSFFKLAPSVGDELLKVSGYYKRSWVNQSDHKKDYTEDTLSLRTTLKLDSPLFYKLSGHFSYGRNDTRESEEDREDNLRFEYRLWDVSGYCRLNKGIYTQFSYGQKERDYFTSINSYDNWFMENETKLKLLEKEPFNLDLLLGGEHKQTKFYENEKLSYKKDSLSGGFNVLKKGDFSLKPTFKFTKYDYAPGSTSNQKSYKAILSFKKYIGSTDKALEVDYWYKWKDYEFKPDSEQWSLNLSYLVKF